jgi:NADH:ubiquinone oxidoreductase subunit H
MSQTLIHIMTVLGVLLGLLGISAGLIWAERRLLALWQERWGPNRVGPAGLLQPVADILKILWKEDWVPPLADRPVFVIAPATPNPAGGRIDAKAVRRGPLGRGPGPALSPAKVGHRTS